MQTELSAIVPADHIVTIRGWDGKRRRYDKTRAMQHLHLVTVYDDVTDHAYLAWAPVNVVAISNVLGAIIDHSVSVYG